MKARWHDFAIIIGCCLALIVLMVWGNAWGWVR